MEAGVTEVAAIYAVASNQSVEGQTQKIEACQPFTLNFSRCKSHPQRLTAITYCR